MSSISYFRQKSKPHPFIASIRLAILVGVYGTLAVVLFQYIILLFNRHPEYTSIVLPLLLSGAAVVGYLVTKETGLNGQEKARSKAVKILSLRERQVFNELCKDQSNKEICERLFIEQSTLKSHINHIYRKLLIRDRKEFLSRYAA